MVYRRNNIDTYVSGFMVEVKKGGDTMETYTSIKCGLRARIEGLEMMIDMYEKDNPMRHNMMIRIDECNRLMRILTVLENEKENENDITEIAGLKEKVKKQREIIKLLLNKLHGKDDNNGNYMRRDCQLCRDICYYMYCDSDSVER